MARGILGITSILAVFVPESRIKFVEGVVVACGRDVEKLSSTGFSNYRLPVIILSV
jgi:hypothetical protein